MKQLSEKILLQRIKLKDHKAAERLIENYYEKVYGLIYSLCKCQETAEDLTHDTFIKVWNSICSFNGLSRFSTWLYRIAFNCFVDWQRKQRIYMSIDKDIENSSINENPLHAISSSEVHQKILEEIDLLPKKLRDMVILHYQHDFSQSEIAKILDIPEGTVKSRINSALQKIRQSNVVKEINNEKQ